MNTFDTFILGYLMVIRVITTTENSNSEKASKKLLYTLPILDNILKTLYF